jgi:hypothetical protein
MKKGKSIKLLSHRDFKINYGTVDSKNLKSIYINIQTWAEPKVDINYPTREVNYLSRSIKHTVLNSINKNIFNDKFIVDLDLRSSGIQSNKKSFLNLECYLYPKEIVTDFKDYELKNSIKKLIDSIIKENFTKNNTFNFTLTKKEIEKV